MEKERAIKIATEITGLYQKHGERRCFGKSTTQLQHAFQSAAIAKAKQCDEEMVLAAFLHDIGHICAAEHNVVRDKQSTVMNPEKIGAAFLKMRRFSERLVKLVQSHVYATRYLSYNEPFYHNRRSEIGQHQLKSIGGKMTFQEAIYFESDPSIMR